MEYLAFALAALALISPATAQLCAQGSQATFSFDNVPVTECMAAEDCAAGVW